MGKPTDPDYWKKYRAAHHDRIRAQERIRNARPEQRRARHRAEDARRRRRRGEADSAPLAPLFPAIVHGLDVSFWEDELKMDLEQEGALAALEGRDPDHARRLYADRERKWHRHARPLFEHETA